jgi:hypothetical protein
MRTMRTIICLLVLPCPHGAANAAVRSTVLSRAAGLPVRKSRYTPDVSGPISRGPRPKRRSIRYDEVQARLPLAQSSPEIPLSIREIMSDPAFEFGVADVRAGRSRRPDYDLWHKINDQWAHERGRMWALLAPRDIQLKRDSKITNDLAVRAARYRDHLMVQEGSDLSPRTGNFSLCERSNGLLTSRKDFPLAGRLF